MARKHQIYWYREQADVRNARLFNCRDDDLHPIVPITKGTIIFGYYGYAIAVTSVRGLSGSSAPFRATHRCKWQGHELRCMAHPKTPAVVRTKADIRRGYVVAELETREQMATAKQLGVPIIGNGERKLVNLECTTFESQGKAYAGRAKLLGKLKE